MILSEKTLQELRDMINEKTTYRSGPTLVCLFNKYGFQDTYGYYKRRLFAFKFYWKI